MVRLRSGDTDLEASLVRRTINGRTLVMFAYNGQYFGLLLQVDEGATYGPVPERDRPQPSAVHWHGIRLENAVGWRAWCDPGRGGTGVSSCTGSTSGMLTSTGITRTFARTSSRIWVSTATSS
ncbi:MAG: hypothetical protein R2882_11500 [Gemmatimonadales bacterium]